MGPADLAVIAGQLGRPPRDLCGIAARCPFGYPAVIETAPVLTGGAPNPTLLYLTCPVLTTTVSGVEAAGAVRAFREWIGTDREARSTLEHITRLYRERRAALAGDRSAAARLEAGIGGPQSPERASCLHAYAAALLALIQGWPAESTAPDTASVDQGEADGTEASAPRSLAALEGSARRIWTRLLPALEGSWCSDSRCTRSIGGERRAAIDVGTISVRVLVAELAGGEVRQLARRAEVTRLGEGLERGGSLSTAARRRTAAVVARYADEARGSGADYVILAGTSAAREAKNGREFIASLGTTNDVPAVVLSGQQEAELAYTGATLDVAGNVVVIDVGGGSTELITRLADGVIEATSLELGASRATDRWIKTDPPAQSEIGDIYEEAKRAVERHRFRFGTEEPGSSRAMRLVGVAGTVTTLACLQAGLEAYDPDVIHLRTLSSADVRGLVARLSAMTTDQRTALPCVQAGRAPVIVAGAVVLLAAMETLEYGELTVSERDLLDGLVLRGRALALPGDETAGETVGRGKV